MKATPVHKTHDSGYYYPHIDTFCGLGDSYDRGFEKGTMDWSKVTCKRCLRHKPTIVKF